LNGSATTAGYKVGLVAIDNTGLFTNPLVSRDLRRFSPNGFTFQDAATAAQLAGTQAFQVPPNDTREVRGPWVLSISRAFPTPSLVVQTSAVAQTAQAWFFGYTRGIRAEEIELGG
jgi:hypothetical protein